MLVHLLKQGGAKGDLDQLHALCTPVLDKDGKQRWALLPDPRVAASSQVATRNRRFKVPNPFYFIP
jgi:hypothetical protein